jgi:2-polyprenyl-6-methoxyphenol hydroxylase-like FAD-dependent oxidoreductase
MPPDQQWDALPNLTLLGDAAHLMPPYAGEGVNMAMLDALELSNALTDPAFPDTLTAIAHYEQQMRARAGDVARITLEQTEALHSPGSIEHMLGVIGQ